MARSILARALGRGRNIDPAAQQAAWRIEAVLLRLFWGVSWALPIAAGSALGARILGFIGPRLRKSLQVRRNLAVMIGEFDPQQIKDLEQAIWRNFGSVMAEYPHMRKIIAERLSVEISPEAQKAIDSGSPCIFCAAHLGNWETCAAWFASKGFALQAVYSPQANPYTDRMLQKTRRSYGCGFVTKQDGLRELMQAISAGSSIGLVMDQRVDNGEMIPFFGRPAATTTVPARLSLKLGIPIMLVETRRLPGAKFVLRAYPPLSPRDPGASAAEQARDLTAQINAGFESWIRQDIGQWHCLKRRWPKVRA